MEEEKEIAPRIELREMSWEKLSITTCKKITKKCGFSLSCVGIRILSEAWEKETTKEENDWLDIY
jgi:hypothetical protein